MNGAIRTNSHTNTKTIARKSIWRPEHRGLLVEALRTYSTGRGLPSALPQPHADRLERTLGALRANARVQYGRFLHDLARLLEDPRVACPEEFVEREALLQMHTWWAANPAHLNAFHQLAQELPHPIRIPAFWAGLLQQRDTANTYRARLAALRMLPDADAFLRAVRRCCIGKVYQHFLAEGDWDTLHRIWQQIPELFACPERTVQKAHLSVGKLTWVSILETISGVGPLPPPILQRHHSLNDQELGWFCHLLKGGSIATLPGLHFAVSPKAVARFTADDGTTRYCEQPRVVTHLFAAVLATNGVPDDVVLLGARFIHGLTTCTAPHWIACCQVLGRMGAAELTPWLMEQPWSLPGMRDFLCALEHCCSSEVFLGVFREGQHRWLYEVWKQAPELFAAPEGGPIVEGPHGSTYAIIEAIMGRHILPEAYLFALRARLGKRVDHNKPLAVREGPLSAMETTWMVHMLKGGGIKSAPGLPFQLTKGAAHLFNVQPLQLPHERYVHAHRIVWRHLVMTELIACGGHRLLAEFAAELVSEEQCGRWVPVLRELIRMGYQWREVRNLLDFLRAPECTIGVPELRRMTARSLNRRMEDWHHELARRKVGMPKDPFPDSGIPTYCTEVNGRGYSIQQVKDAHELFVEGKQMHHCVASYVEDCISGKAAIFSLRRCEAPCDVRLVTIQVSGRAVVQAKGPCNREPNEIETMIIKDWVAASSTLIPGGIRYF